MALCHFLRTPTGHFHHPHPCDNASRALGQAPCEAVVREVCVLRCIKIAVILGVVAIIARSVSPLESYFSKPTTRQSTGTIQEVVIRARPQSRITVLKFGGSNPRLQHAKQSVLALKHYAEQKPVERLHL